MAVLDAGGCYREILANIIALAPFDVQLTFRSVSRTCKAHADVELFRHVLLCSHGYEPGDDIRLHAPNPPFQRLPVDFDFAAYSTAVCTELGEVNTRELYEHVLRGWRKVREPLSPSPPPEVEMAVSPQPPPEQLLYVKVVDYRVLAPRAAPPIQYLPFPHLRVLRQGELGPNTAPAPKVYPRSQGSQPPTFIEYIPLSPTEYTARWAPDGCRLVAHLPYAAAYNPSSKGIILNTYLDIVIHPPEIWEAQPVRQPSPGCMPAPPDPFPRGLNMFCTLVANEAWRTGWVRVAGLEALHPTTGSGVGDYSVRAAFEQRVQQEYADVLAKWGTAASKTIQADSWYPQPLPVPDVQYLTFAEWIAQADPFEYTPVGLEVFLASARAKQGSM